MDIRVVPDAIASLEAGIAPVWASPPRDRESILLPFTERERAMLCGLAIALTVVEQLPDTEPELTAYRALAGAWKSVTGLRWSETPWVTKEEREMAALLKQADS